MKLVSGKKKAERQERVLKRLRAKEVLNEREQKEVAILERRTGR